MGGSDAGSASPAAASGSAGALPAAAVLGPPAAGHGGKVSVKGGGAGPSNASFKAPMPSETALVATGSPQDATFPSPPTDDKSGGKNNSKACAGCGAVGKCFRCSRCRLVFYCSKDCQASDIS